MKPVLLFVLAIFMSLQAFGQNAEEGIRSADPVKTAQVYPNPAVDYLSIKFESPISKSVKFSFHSIIGTPLELEQEAVDNFEVKIKVKDLAAGYYIVVVHDAQSNTRGVYKFLKK
ncbi:MAG: T9SS type A sorting domain-containing protein [Bacteroidetes bacterium]|nr:T9SS type A sorting domain-containing protein [Bacteroidota bacterium]